MVKHVTFNNEVKVKYMVVWGYAYKASRNGLCWIQMAMDRDRFKRRIREFERIMNHR